MTSLKGKVITQTTEEADEQLKRLVKKYLGIGKYYYRKPSHKQIIIKIKPESVVSAAVIFTVSILSLRLLKSRNSDLLI
jgi:hypothetical protein